VTRTALVITASDGAAAGVRLDTSGARVGSASPPSASDVERRVVADEQWAIEAALVDGAAGHHLVITTRDGLTPRDVSRQATEAVIDYAVPAWPRRCELPVAATTPLAD